MWRVCDKAPRLQIDDCCFGLDQIVEQASAGLAGMKDDDVLGSYDNLVKSKGILDLVLELPSFEAELGEGCCRCFACGATSKCCCIGACCTDYSQ